MSAAPAGADSQLWVRPVGPTTVDALAGSNVTLAVTFSYVAQPAITWFMGAFPVATYIINSTTEADIARNASMVVKVDPRGYLTFHNVSRLYTSTYTLEVTKSGFGEASVTFTLTVFGAYQVISDSAEINLIAQKHSIVQQTHNCSCSCSLDWSKNKFNIANLYSFVLNHVFIMCCCDYDVEQLLLAANVLILAKLSVCD